MAGVAEYGLQVECSNWHETSNRELVGLMQAYEVSSPDGDVLGVVRARSPGSAIRRINEICGVSCAVVGRLLFFGEEHRRTCAGRWMVRRARLRTKAAHLTSANYEAEGPATIFVA